LRIGIDARELEGKMTGIGRYLVALIRYLSKTPHEYFLYYSCSPQTDLSSLNVKTNVLKGHKLLWDQVTLPRALKREGIEVFFSPYFKKPWRLSCRSIITVNDLNPLFNDGFSSLHRFYFKRTVSESVLSADFILTLSSYVREQLLEKFHAESNKVIVNPCAVKEFFSPVKDESALKAVLARYGINSEYIFYVGTLMPHKNVASLIRSYGLLHADLKDKYRLVIGGGKDWDYDKLVRLAGKLCLINNVIFTGFILDEDLVFLYSGAKLFVFPYTSTQS
jgi:glycosyltransferase involved in cell wall biosynthesis